jgi:3-dehydroquinate synthase
MIDEAARQRIVAVIEKAGLPVRGLKLSTEQVVAAMAFDKKVATGRLRFVLPTEIGKVVIRDDVPREMVTAAVRFLATDEHT